MPAPPPLTQSGSLLELSNFPALRRLQAPLPFFLGFSPEKSPPLMVALPPKLESLCVGDDLCSQEENAWENDDLSSNFLPTLESWLPALKTSNPNLRRFRYLMNADERRPRQEEERFHELCKKVDLEAQFG
jgi:hypothetical protein